MYHIPLSRIFIVHAAAIIGFVAVSLIIVPTVLGSPAVVSAENLKNVSLLTASLVLAQAIKTLGFELSTRDMFSPGLIRFQQISWMLAVPLLYGLLVSYGYQAWLTKSTLEPTLAALLAVSSGGYCLIALITARNVEKWWFKPTAILRGNRNI